MENQKEPKSPEGSNDRIGMSSEAGPSQPSRSAENTDRSAENADRSEGLEPCNPPNTSRVEQEMQSGPQQAPSSAERPAVLDVDVLEALTQATNAEHQGVLDVDVLEALTQATAYRSFLSPEQEPSRRFSPYTVHQRLFVRQQLEQERRRQGMQGPSAISHPLPLLHINYEYTFSDKSRIQTARKIGSYMDKRSVKSTSTAADHEDICIICMCHYKVDEELRKLKCNHKFHIKCIDKWLVKSLVCPVCRTDLMDHVEQPRRMSAEVTVLFNRQLPPGDGNSSSDPHRHNQTKD